MKKKCKKSIFEKFGFHLEREVASIDLVCGMDVDFLKAQYSSVYKKKKYFFCSQSCKEHFDNDPEKYIGE